MSMKSSFSPWLMFVAGTVLLPDHWRFSGQP